MQLLEESKLGQKGLGQDIKWRLGFLLVFLCIIFQIQNYRIIETILTTLYMLFFFLSFINVFLSLSNCIKT